MHSSALIGKPNCLKVLCKASRGLIIPLTTKYLLQIVITTWKGLASTLRAEDIYAAQGRQEATLPKEGKNSQVFRNPYVWD